MFERICLLLFCRNAMGQDPAAEAIIAKGDKGETEKIHLLLIDEDF